MKAWRQTDRREMVENKDERQIQRVLKGSERFCSPQSCLQEVLLKLHRWLHSQKDVLLHFLGARKLPSPSFMCGKL